MPTNLVLDERLVDEAKRLGRHRSRKDAVHAALREYVAQRRQAPKGAGASRLAGRLPLPERAVDPWCRGIRERNWRS
jgi:Arc/MetJ family transcription regulator